MEPAAAKKHSSNLMDYLIGGKTVKEYLRIVKKPLMALIELYVVSFFLGFLAYTPAASLSFLATIHSIINVLISLTILVIDGYIGYSIVKRYDGDLLSASAAGAIVGLISGTVRGVLNLVSVWLFFEMAPGFASGLLLNSYMSELILSPIFGVIIGAILALIGGLIAEARNFGPASASTRPEIPKPEHKP